MKQDTVIEALDKVFTPDIKVLVKGNKSVIVAYEALTKAGATFLLHNPILEKSYDNVIFSNVCVELRVQA